MNNAHLWDLAADSFSSTRILNEAATEWRELAASTRDARYLIAAETVELIRDAFGDYDALPTPMLAEVWRALRRGLPMIRDAPDSETGASRAMQLRDEIDCLLVSRR